MFPKALLLFYEKRQWHGPPVFFLQSNFSCLNKNNQTIKTTLHITLHNIVQAAFPSVKSQHIIPLRRGDMFSAFALLLTKFFFCTFAAVLPRFRYLSVIFENCERCLLKPCFRLCANLSRFSNPFCIEVKILPLDNLRVYKREGSCWSFCCSFLHLLWVQSHADTWNRNEFPRSHLCRGT